MPEKTMQEQMEEMQAQLSSLKQAVEEKDAVIKRQGDQISNLRGAPSSLDRLDDDVRADAISRMSAGIPKDIAIELALKQDAHHKALHKDLSPAAKKEVAQMVDDKTHNLPEAIAQAKVNDLARANESATAPKSAKATK